MEQRHMFMGKFIDSARVVEDAVKKSKGDLRNAPMKVTIHYHTHSVSCVGYAHEDFLGGESQGKEVK